MDIKSVKSTNLSEENNQGIIPIIRGKRERHTLDSIGGKIGKGSLNELEIQQREGSADYPTDCSLIEKGYCTPNKYLPCPSCKLEAKILIILMNEMPRGTPELAEILKVECSKARQACDRLKKEGWVTERKLSSKKALNYFPITCEVVTRQNRLRIYRTIFKLQPLIKNYTGNDRAIEKCFNTLLNSRWLNVKQNQCIKNFMKKLMATLKTSGIDDALYMVGLIPFPPKTLYWNLRIYISKKELDIFLQAA